VHLKHASMTPRNREYHEYNPPGVQLSCDALATKIPFAHSFLSVKLCTYISYRQISSVPSRSVGQDQLVFASLFRMVIIDVIRMFATS
jgi:hypothetical protein